jgi:hypothetical protein
MQRFCVIDHDFCHFRRENPQAAFRRQPLCFDAPHQLCFIKNLTEVLWLICKFKVWFTGRFL